MLNKDQLYKNISYLLINIFKSDTLKVNILKKEELKKNVFLQINNLLSLEKDYDCNFDGQAYAIEFAQSLVNLTEQEQTIEKQDNKLIQEIESDYSFLLTYILNIYGIEKEKMSAVSEINSTLIEQLSYITDQSLLKSNPVKPDDIIENSESTQKQQQNPFSGADRNGKNVNVNFNSYNENAQPNLMFLNSIPPHPATDPRFYPFLTKSKHMPLIKILILFLVSAVIIANAILFAYAYFFPQIVNIGNSSSVYKEFWANKSNNQVLISTPGNEDNYHHFGTNGKEIKIPFIKSFYTLLPAFLIVIMAIYICFQIFKKPATIREKFRIRPYDLVALLILNLLPIFYWGTIFADFKISFLPEKDSEKKQVEQLANFITEYIKKSQHYQITFALAIISISIAAVSLVFITFVLFINPKLDQQKINLANEEYQKAMASAMNGKTYEFDSSLFDEFDVEEKVNDFKNKDK